MKTNMHRNSLDAYTIEHPKLTSRARLILENINQHGAATDREIRSRMGYSDMNMVRPRITELIERGELIEIRQVLDKTTNKTVRVVGPLMKRNLWT